PATGQARVAAWATREHRAAGRIGGFLAGVSEARSIDGRQVPVASRPVPRGNGGPRRARRSRRAVVPRPTDTDRPARKGEAAAGRVPDRRRGATAAVPTGAGGAAGFAAARPAASATPDRRT